IKTEIAAATVQIYIVKGDGNCQPSHNIGMCIDFCMQIHFSKIILYLYNLNELYPIYNREERDTKHQYFHNKGQQEVVLLDIEDTKRTHKLSLKICQRGRREIFFVFKTFIILFVFMNYLIFIYLIMYLDDFFILIKHYKGSINTEIFDIIYNAGIAQSEGRVCMISFFSWIFVSKNRDQSRVVKSNA
ncbi:hypothetical protein ACJX0J_038053, partial [Zea mays]